ncbi:MAG TPA: HIT family protein [Cytophagales bacterium]|nr:HIT family protein [Cytophagales bacterium]
MLKIADLTVSEVFLFKEQSHYGRCNVVYKSHGVELHELDAAQRDAFMTDVAVVAKAIQRVCNPTKINYGAFADKLSHLHMHIVPKYNDGLGFGGTFEMNPQQTYLSEAAYQDLIGSIKDALTKG